MTDQRLQIVTFGRLQAGFDRETVAANIARLCKYDARGLARVFSGQRFVFKEGVDRPTAERYLKVLQQTGIVCRVEPQAAPAPAVPLVEVSCPKCGTRQPKAVSCVRCQVVMARYRPHPSSVQAQEQSFSTPPAPPLTAAKSGLPLLKILLVLLVFAAGGAWYLTQKPFASTGGVLDAAASSYRNERFDFSFAYPPGWKAYSVDEAIQCATIRREYADDYLLLISPTNPQHCMLVVNISGITRDYFEQEGWQGVVRTTGKRHRIAYQSVDRIDRFKVYRVGYEIAGAYREDAYFEANGTMIQIYFYVLKSFDTADRTARMRALLDQNLRSI